MGFKVTGFIVCKKCGETMLMEPTLHGQRCQSCYSNVSNKRFGYIKYLVEFSESEVDMLDDFDSGLTKNTISVLENN